MPMTAGADDDGARPAIVDGRDNSPTLTETELVDRYLRLCRRVAPPHFFWRAPTGDILLGAGMRTRRMPPDPTAWRAWCREDLRLDDGIPTIFLAYFSPTKEKHQIWGSFSPVHCFQPEAGLLLRNGKSVQWGPADLSQASTDRADADETDSAERQHAATRRHEVTRCHEATENSARTETTTHSAIFAGSSGISDAEDYRDRVRQVLEILRERKLGKVVLARESRMQLSRPLDLARILGSMLRQRDSYTLCYSPDGQQHFLSATPEQLGRIVDGRFETVALAGTTTLPATTIGDEQLIGDAKEFREHEFVVEMIRNGCETFATDVTVDATRVLALRHIRHILTRVEGSMRPGCGLRHVIAALHPTPAVGGTPRTEAMRVIEELEPFARGMYAGCAGWFLGDGDGEAAVTIRSALLREDAAILWAGAGIVHGSSAEAEERETDAKLRTMRDILAG